MLRHNTTRMGIDHRVPLSDWLLDVIASVFYTAQFSSDLLTCSHDKFGSVFEIYWARVEEMLGDSGSVYPVGLVVARSRKRSIS